MDQLENRNIVIGGRRFRDLDDLEDYCFRFPEFEEDVIESGLLVLDELKASVNTYWIASKLEYGDGNEEAAYKLRCGWYGKVLLDQDQ